MVTPDIRASSTALNDICLFSWIESIESISFQKKKQITLMQKLIKILLL
jgi:hypothetical protein